MAKLKSAKHHWWPEGVSDFWKDANGCVHRLTPNGSLRQAPPKNFGILTNGHLFKLGSTPAEPTPWDQDYEAEFQKPDDQFPWVIRWLEDLPREERYDRPYSERFVSETAPHDKALALFEGVVSLAVRSPRTRVKSVGLAEALRGPLSPQERQSILGLNHRYIYRSIVSNPPMLGKFVVLYSPDKEFIFGDGFFHNVAGQTTPIGGLKILAPLTPSISVLYANPSSYRVDPKLVTLVISAKETEDFNNAVQTYSNGEIFYRSEHPNVIDAFRQAQHCIWKSPRNPIDSLIDQIPGVDPRDLRLHDQLESMRREPLVPPE